ncbi:MAG: ATP synthase F1 subunit delta [Turicibacter sp.]|nr:ATP synthase F1 subunit delta [Turicibacter sp.]
MAQLVNRYATAVFELSVEGGRLEENLSQAVVMKEALADKDCQSIITHPRISAAEKRAFFDEAFKDKVSSDLLGLLYLAVDKGREEYIVPILASFIDMANDRLRKTTAVVVSAVPLAPRQIGELAALLSRKLSKEVVIEQRVDTSIIGGLYIQVDGYYVDRTIKSRLQELKLNMAV